MGTYSAVNRLISTSSCVATVVFFKLALFSFKKKQESLNSIIDIVVLASSILAGNASVAACGGEINQTSALIIGVVGGFIYTLSNYGMQRFQIDDPLQSTQSHLFCGLWGVISLGIFHKKKGLLTTGSFRFLLIQFLGAIIVATFVGVLAVVFFKNVKRRFHFRLSKIEEVLGLDIIWDADVL